MAPHLDRVVTNAIWQRLTESKSHRVKRAGENVTCCMVFPVTPRHYCCWLRRIGEIDNYADLPTSEFPDRSEPVPGCLNSERHADRIAFVDGNLVDEQIRCLVHPV